MHNRKIYYNGHRINKHHLKNIYDGNDKSTGDQLYTGVSSFGVIMSDIKAVLGTIIGLIMIIVGIYCLTKKDLRTSTTSGTIVSEDIDQQCIETINNNSIIYSCYPMFSYTINGTLYSKRIKIDGNKKYFKGNTLTLYYDPNNIDNIDTVSDDLKMVGWMLIGFGIFIMIGSILWAYLANKYKPIAAVEGIFSGVNMITGRGF
jgi:hypothetical protein